jgi:phage-related protein (TIGR01555 family)
MALLDRLRRRFAPPPATPTPRAAIPVADISDPNKLTQGARGVLGELYTSTSALINAFTGMGTNRDPASYNQWAVPRTLNRGAHFGMGRNALINQALSKLPSTATREGWRVTITDDRVEDKEGCSDQIAAYESRLGMQSAVARAATRGRQYSQGLVVLGIEDGREFSEPVDWQNIQTIRWAVVLDNRDFQPYEMFQADSRHFGKVKTFLITDLNGILEDGLRYGPDAVAYQYSQLQAELDNKQGSLYIHAERVLYFPTVDYLSLLDTLQDSLGSYFTAMNGVATAAREASMVVYKITDWIRKAWSEDANLAHAHMSFVDKAKSTINAWVIDKDKEEVSIESRSLGGVADLPNPSMVWVSASLGTPVTEFWGVSPGGFGKGDAERETWHSQVRAYQRWLAPQLTHLHALILVAKDGCNLPRDTQRTIAFEDLSPPDEQVRSDLRSKALDDATKAFEKGGMTRDEYRATLAALSDDYFRFVRTSEGERVTADAPVGVFTGTLEILLAAARGEIPVASAKSALIKLAPSSFTPESAAEITDPIAAARNAIPATASSTSSGIGAGGSVIPIDEEDIGEETDEFESLWSTAAPPADANTAKKLVEIGGFPSYVTGLMITNAAKAQRFPTYKSLHAKPRPLYSLREVKQAILSVNEAEPAPATDANPRSLCVAVKLPPEFALWVPHKSEDPSPAHVTLLYVPDVDPSEIDAVLAELHETFCEMMPFHVTHTGNISYFDTPQGKSARVAYAETRFSVDPQALFEDLADGVAAFGLEPARHGEKYMPHTTLAYLREPAATYAGPVPEGSWQVIEAVAWYGNEEIDAFPLQGIVEEVDNAGPVHDRATGTSASKAASYWVWTTQRDGRVRPEHARLNGRRFREGVEHPTQGEPGSAPNCRCAKKVYVPPGSPRSAHEAATRTVRRALIRSFKRVSEPALKRAAQGRDDMHDALDDFDEAAWVGEADDLSEGAKAERIAEAYKKFHASVNMGAAELREWAKSPWSKKASVSHTPIDRNLRLLETAREDWTLATAASALRTVNFVSRMKGAEQGEPVKIDGRTGPSKRDISLKNWAFDPGK